MPFCMTRRQEVPPHYWETACPRFELCTRLIFGGRQQRAQFHFDLATDWHRPRPNLADAIWRRSLPTGDGYYRKPPIPIGRECSMSSPV